jgi:surface antigen
MFWLKKESKQDKLVKRRVLKMRTTAILAGVFLCGVVFITNSPKAAALEPYQIALDSSASISHELDVIELVEAQAQKSLPQSPGIQEHAVAAGETLTTIAEQHDTTWQRLYAKNTQVSHPDIINPGEKIAIPAADEQLAERTLPELPSNNIAITQSKSVKQPATSTISRGPTSGNTYTWGYCTWYAKSRRPDLPNNLGNADTWVSRAAAQGIPTGSTPRSGAIGQRGMHVVYVERVNADGTVYISEMNYQAVGVVTFRTVAASYFYYIY